MIRDKDRPRGDTILTLARGQVFGGEIPRGESIRLMKTKLAIFSWSGGTVSVVGEPKAVYKVPQLCVFRECVLVFSVCFVSVNEFLAGITCV